MKRNLYYRHPDEQERNPSAAVTVSVFGLLLGGMVFAGWYFWTKNKLRLQIAGVEQEIELDETEEHLGTSTVVQATGDEDSMPTENSKPSTGPVAPKAVTPPSAPTVVPVVPADPKALPIPMPPLDEEDQYIRAIDWLDSRRDSPWFGAIPEEDPFLKVQRIIPRFYKPNSKVLATRADAPSPMAVGPKSDPKVAELIKKMDDYLRANGVVVDDKVNAWELTVMRNIKGLSWPSQAAAHPCAIPVLGMWGNIIPTIYTLRIIEQWAAPITKIYNGYRAPEYDDAVGGETKNSAHVWFAAIDFTPSNKDGSVAAAKKLYDDKQFAFQLGYNQYKPSKNMHIDTFFKKRCCWSDK